MKQKFVITMLLVVFLVMNGIAQDDEESPVLALPLLSEGVPVEDTLSDEVQGRLYGFNANAGDVVTLAMTQTGEDLDPYLVLLGAAGEMIAADDDSGEELFSALIADVEIPETGSYFVFATSFEFIDTLLDFGDDEEAPDYSYEIVLTGTGAESTEDTEFTYFSAEAVIGETYTSTISEEELVFYYRFMGEAEQTININLSSDEFDTILHVFSPGGGRIAVNDDGLDGTNSEITGLVLPEDGVYLIFATEIFFYQDLLTGDLGTGEFTLSITEG